MTGSFRVMRLWLRMSLMGRRRPAASLIRTSDCCRSIWTARQPTFGKTRYRPIPGIRRRQVAGIRFSAQGAKEAVLCNQVQSRAARAATSGFAQRGSRRVGRGESRKSFLIKVGFQPGDKPGVAEFPLRQARKRPGYSLSEQACPSGARTPFYKT